MLFINKNKTILFSLLATLTLMILATAAVIASHRKEAQLPCVAEFKVTLHMGDSSVNARGIFILLEDTPDRLSLSVQSMLRTDGKEYMVNRKLTYQIEQRHTPQAEMINMRLIGSDKFWTDSAPDRLGNNFLFQTYKNKGRLYVIKHINEDTLLIGSGYSPMFTCVINRF
jgi:hypothetical protein